MPFHISQKPARHYAETKEGAEGERSKHPSNKSDSDTHRHRPPIRLGVHRLPGLPQRGQQLEVVDVECRRVGVEELGLDVVRVGEGVRRPRRDRHVVARLGVDGLAVQRVEAQGALGDEEGFVVLIREQRGMG